MTIRAFMAAMREWNEAAAEVDRCTADCAYSPDYHCATQFRALEHAEEHLAEAFREAVREAVKETGAVPDPACADCDGTGAIAFDGSQCGCVQPAEAGEHG